MIKHWRLYDSITATQIKQLYTADITVRRADDTGEIDFPMSGRVRYVKSYDIYISTVNEKQESFLFLMFNSDKLLLVETEYDNRYYNG